MFFIPSILAFYWVIIHRDAYSGASACEFRDSAINGKIIELLQWHNPWIKVEGSNKVWPNLICYNDTVTGKKESLFLQVGDSLCKNSNTNKILVFRNNKKYDCYIPTWFCALQF